MTNTFFGKYFQYGFVPSLLPLEAETIVVGALTLNCRKLCQNLDLFVFFILFISPSLRFS